MSYDGQVNFGLIGDYDAMADLDSFGLDLEAVAAETVATVPARKAARRKVTQKASSNGAGPVAAERSS
jgi:hypothetical protein